MLRCTICYVARSHLSPPSTKSHSPNPAPVAASNTKQIFPIMLALRVSSPHQIFFTASHSSSCRLTFYPSHPPVPFVHAGGGRCQLSCSTRPTGRSCPPPSQEMEGGRATGLLASCRPPQGHSQQSGEGWAERQGFGPLSYSHSVEWAMCGYKRARGTSREQLMTRFISR